MSPIAVELPENHFRVASCEMLDKLITVGDGDAALVYLYLLRHGAVTDQKQAARALALPPERFERAVFTITSLQTSVGGSQTDRENAPPHYTAGELRRARQEDEKFAAVCHAAEDVFGRMLTESQLRCLWTAYDHLGLSAEALMELLSYLKKEKGKVQLADLRHESYNWADMGIVSAQQAQDYLAKLANAQPILEAIYQVLETDSKNPAPGAQRVANFALLHGFPPEAVALSAKRTVKRKGVKRFSYIYGILESWEKACVHTVSEITALEPELRAADQTALPDNNPLLADWEEDWAARIRNHLEQTPE